MMAALFFHTGSIFFRPTFYVFVGVGFFCAAAVSSGQRISDRLARPGMERIDQEEGAQRLASFREQRLDGDYVFEFQLEHKPRSAPTVRYDGVMWGTWNESGPLTRLQILPRRADETSTPEPLVDLIVQNGVQPRAWRKNDRGNFELMQGEALFEPILPEVVYSVFDLLMPFIYWEKFIYEGPDLFGASRVAQNFLMLPPEGSESERQGIKAVRIGLDDTYNALWRVEILGEEDEVRSKFAVRSFKKVQEQYIVNRITLTEYPARDATTFRVIEASVGLLIDEAMFDVNQSDQDNEDSTCSALIAIP